MENRKWIKQGRRHSAGTRRGRASADARCQTPEQVTYVSTDTRSQMPGTVI